MNGNKILTVMEVGINANGSIENAKKLITHASHFEFSYIKFQKRDLSLVYSPEELSMLRENPFGKTNGDLKRALEFSKEQYDEIDEFCKSKNIKWFLSVWDVNSVDFAVQYNPDFIKIPSPLVTNKNILYKVKETGIPVIMSVGMSTEKEVDDAIDILQNNLVYLLHCTSSYPCPTTDMNMKKILTLKNKYSQYKIGFSNHSSGLTFCIVAASLGAEMIEIHCTLDRSQFGTDQSSSIEPEGMMRITKYMRSIDAGLGDGSFSIQPSELPIIKKLRKA
jgi:N-acetylneuraminate synthase